MGQVYVEVTGEAVNNGIMAIDSSGGQTSGQYWIKWTADGGFTGTGWETAWNSSNVPLQTAWTSAPAEGFSGDFNGFLAYVASGAQDLNPWLDGAGWTNEAKWEFMQGNPTIFLSCADPA